MPIKSVKMKISKNKKMCFFLMSQGSFNPQIWILGQKVCFVVRLHTHRPTYRHTDTPTDTHESSYCGHPFRVSEVFLQPIIKDRPNNDHTLLKVY